MSGVEKSVNPKVQRANGRANFCETFVLLSGTFLVCGLFVLNDNGGYLRWWIAGCVVATVSFLVLALLFSSFALATYQSTTLEVTSQTMKTLRAIKAPFDLVDCLSNLKGKTAETEETFFAGLDDVLGAERCAELKSTIFKYVKTSS